MPRTRHNVHVAGEGRRTIVLAHGFGCDQTMWRHVAPDLARDHRVVLFDHVGCGEADRGAYRIERHRDLRGYAEDVIDLLQSLDLQDAVFVGHSVSAMIGLLAVKRDPRLISHLIMVGPSPRYVDDQDYYGGFTRADVDELLALLEENHRGWSEQMAPVIMGNADRPGLAQELANSFCRMDPLVARYFARATFLSDLRAELPDCLTPTLIMQCSEDAIVPVDVGRYLNRTLPRSEFVLMRATGHCPHLSAPGETIAVIREYLQRNAAVAGR